jgi:hypothetical protein
MERKFNNAVGLENNKLRNISSIITTHSGSSFYRTTILQYHEANEIVVQILQHRMVKDNDLIQSANI